MNYRNKLEELLTFYKLPSLNERYKDADDFEKCILLLRFAKMSYSNIQSHLGNPSKKLIRQVLLKWCPDAIDNSEQKRDKFCSAYSQIYKILSKTNKIDWELFGNDAKLYIKDKKIYYNDDLLNMWSEVEQTQILNEINSDL